MVDVVSVVPVDVVRIMAAFAPAAFVRVSRGPWARACLVDRVYMANFYATVVGALSHAK